VCISSRLPHAVSQDRSKFPQVPSGSEKKRGGGKRGRERIRRWAEEKPQKKTGKSSDATARTCFALTMTATRTIVDVRATNTPHHIRFRFFVSFGTNNIPSSNETRKHRKTSHTPKQAWRHSAVFGVIIIIIY